MAETRFDTIARGLATDATRRRVFGGLLAGLGAVATGALVGRSVTAAPSDTALCHKQCNTDARTAREACADLKGKEKNTCLKEVQTTRVACHKACNPEEEEEA